MSRLWDWLTGQEQERQKAAELSRQRTRELQEAGLDRSVREAAQKQPEAIQRVENEPRPGERFMPHQIERQRQMHDHPPAPEKKPDLVIERVATRMENTITPQPNPSMSIGGSRIRWNNPRAQQPTVADKLLDAGRAHLEKEGPQQPELGNDIDAFRAPGSNPLFPDYSKGLQLKPPSGKKPGDTDQQ